MYLRPALERADTKPQFEFLDQGIFRMAREQINKGICRDRSLRIGHGSNRSLN
jgi:hypothetical protein